jgi:hypothetical protein
MGRMGGLERDAHREKFKGDNMSNIGFITSKVNEMSVSLTTLNRIAILLVAAAAIAVALHFVASYLARNVATQLDNAKDELIRLENKEQALQITKVKADSEERIARVKAEIEEHIALLTSEAAKTKGEITKAKEKAEVEQLERMRLEAWLAPRAIEQRQSAKELLQFQGINVIIESLAESESWRTAGQLAWLLSDSKWNVLPGMKRSLDTAAFGDGVTIETNGEVRVQREDRSLAAAKTLMEVLGKNKVQTDWRPSKDHMPVNTLKIRVGLKPVEYADHNRENAAYGNVLYR